MEIHIPIVDQTVSTDDPASAGTSFIAAVVGVLGLFGVMGVANYLYGRIANVAGVDSDMDIPVA